MRRKTVHVAFGALGTLIGAAIVLVSLDRRDYHFYRVDDLVQWQHPTFEVATTVLMALGEAALASMAFGSDCLPSLWQRSLGALVFLAPCAYYSGLFVVHAPGFLLLHMLWAWLVTATVAAALVVSVLYNVLLRLRQRSTQ